MLAPAPLSTTPNTTHTRARTLHCPTPVQLSSCPSPTVSHAGRACSHSGAATNKLRRVRHNRPRQGHAVAVASPVWSHQPQVHWTRLSPRQSIGRPPTAQPTQHRRPRHRWRAATTNPPGQQAQSVVSAWANATCLAQPLASQRKRHVRGEPWAVAMPRPEQPVCHGLRGVKRGANHGNS